ncbi:MAG: YjzC family protein [Clostridia bacterium]|nr:YjzC family protein [Clostridia bacterium]
MEKWKPGEQAPEDGSYACYDEQGKCGGSVYLDKGQRFPATQHSGSYYVKD